MLINTIICFIAGIGAGLGTGFAGMSAAAVIAPMLITFIGIDPYEAVGIALASDVLASGVSAFTFGRRKNLDIRNGLLMMGIVLVFTFITSYLSSFLSGGTIGGFSTFMLPLMGIKFIVKPIMITKDQMGDENPKKRLVKVIGTSILIGCVCGFIGAGGGMMMLLVLTSILGYELKTAIGTSVFIMTFTAFTGAASHFVIGGVGDVYILLVCVISTLIWARIAAVIANRVSPKILNRTLGIVLTVLGVGMIIFKYAF